MGLSMHVFRTASSVIVIKNKQLNTFRIKHYMLVEKQVNFDLKKGFEIAILTVLLKLGLLIFYNFSFSCKSM